MATEKRPYATRRQTTTRCQPSLTRLFNGERPMNERTFLTYLLVAIFLGVLGAGCADDEEEPRQICELGEVRSCPCGGGQPDGTQRCIRSGTQWSQCDCDTSSSNNNTDVNECTPDCSGNDCGSDGCGGSCGSCVDGEEECSYGSCCKKVSQECLESSDCCGVGRCGDNGVCCFGDQVSCDRDSDCCGGRICKESGGCQWP